MQNRLQGLLTLKEKEKKQRGAIYIGDIQRLVTEIKILKVVLHGMHTHSLQNGS